MSDPTLVPPPQDKTPAHYATEPARVVEYATLPPDVTLKPDGIVFQHNVFVVSVVTMVFTSLVTFYLPLFSGLLGGTFGGYHAGRMKRALGAALVSSVMVPAIIMFAYLFDTPDLLRFFWGLGIEGFVVLHVLGTFIGAVAGAASRPLVTERNEFRYATLNTSRIPRGGTAPTTPDSTSRAGSVNVPPREV